MFKNLVAICLALFLGFVPEANAAVPNKPTSVVATKGTSATNVTVEWLAPTSGAAVSSYKLLRSQTNSCGSATVVTTGVAGLTYNDAPPGSGVVYYYFVLATNVDGDSACSDPSPAPTFNHAGWRGNPSPARPENITASQSELDRIIIGWQAPVSPVPIQEYLVYRSNSPAFCNDPGSTLIATVSSTTFTHIDLQASPDPQPGGVYYYTMRSRSTGGMLSNCAPDQPVEGAIFVPPPPLAPVNLSATDGTFADKIVASWQKPVGGETITGYRLYRSTSSLAHCEAGDLIAGTIPEATLSYNDSVGTPTIIQGVQYYYSIESYGPTGTSSCVADPGYARINAPAVVATDGIFPDKVEVEWIAPTGTAPITGYKIFRSDSPSLTCAPGEQIASVSSTTFKVTDTNVSPGKQYYYAAIATAATGPSACGAIDPGFAKISAPTNVSATDGTFPDKVDVTWTPPTGSPAPTITGYRIFRSDIPGVGCSGAPIATVTGTSTLKISDFNVTKGFRYYYSVMSISPAGLSACSNVDEGYPSLPQCSDGIDNDGDGAIDYPDDAGCDNPLDDNEEDDFDAPLVSPTFSKFNTYLGQQNYLELTNQGDTEKQVQVTMFNLKGEAMIGQTITLDPNSQFDLDVNALLVFACANTQTNCDEFQDLSATQDAPNGKNSPDGVVDTYGLIRLDFEDADPASRLRGRMSFYRTNPDDQTFSFAFARELRNATTGTTYALSNTYDPQGQGFLVPNWVEVINFDKQPREFVINTYSQDGTKRDSKSITLPPLGEFDVQGGHEFRNQNGAVDQDVYLIEVIPSSSKTKYFLSVSRYSSNSPVAVDPETYNFAFTVEGAPGTAATLYAPINNKVLGVEGVNSATQVTNWVEVANVSGSDANVTIIYKTSAGDIIDTQTETIKSKGQYHFNAGAVLDKFLEGIVEIHSSHPVIAQSMSYVHGVSNILETGFISTARPPSTESLQTGSINTFLGMQDVLTMFATTKKAFNVGVSATSFSGSSFSTSSSINGGGFSSLELSNNSSFELPTSTYGAITLSTTDTGKVRAEVRRVRVFKGEVDFVMPTLVQ